ncbi:TetR/AcrR family transcriptional regulator [Dietzia sp.]|uniref:TetR/AcrR family transcriptional regulator n=1 Tax=Dietzia sp. TaxID=1871616 RepID=UPI002FDB161C
MSTPGNTEPEPKPDRSGSSAGAGSTSTHKTDGGGNGRDRGRRRRRVYGGKTASERESARRLALLDAAFHLVGANGYGAATVRAICRQAGLSERYFYESFSSRGDILATLYDQHIEEIRDRVLAAVAEVAEDDVAEAEKSGAVHPLITAATRGYVEYCLEDPLRANITVIDATTAGADREDGLIPSANFSFSRLIEDYAVALLGRPHPRLRECSIGMVGFSSRLLNWWYTSGKRGDGSELVEPITLMLQAMIDRMATELSSEDAGGSDDSFTSVREHLSRPRPARTEEP